MKEQSDFESSQDTVPISRKHFLEQGFNAIKAHVADLLPSLDEPDIQVTSVKLRPPGALPESDFLSQCEPYCNECRNSCPKNAIFQDALGFPYIEPEVSPCVMCVDVPCSKVCPTEALTPLLTPQEIRLGVAIIELTVCTAYQGSGCQVCYTACPVSGEAIYLEENLPLIRPEQCTGCGVCVYECPTPEAISIQPSESIRRSSNA